MSTQANLRQIAKRYEIFSWGSLLALFGILSIIPGDQTNIFLIGAGIIFIGVNIAAQYLHKIPVSWFWICVGLVSLVLGVLSQLKYFGSPLSFSLFDVFLVVIGIYLIGKSLMGHK